MEARNVTPTPPPPSPPRCVVFIQAAMSGRDQVKQQDGENKVKVAGMGGVVVVVVVDDVGRGRRKASFDVESVDPACCLECTQVW